jgi:diguanylate cyclase (GGDEF)-like protein
MELYTDSRALSRVTDANARSPAPAHLGDMLDSLTDGFMCMDRSWRFTYLNHTAERYLQQKRETLLGRDLWECYPDLVGSAYYHVYRETAETGRPGKHTGYYAPLSTWFEARSFAHEDGITVLFRDVTREHEYAAALEFEARHDYLTGLYNRRECMEVLARFATETGPTGALQGAALAVLFIDLDHFKEVNDACGDAGGDGVLRDFAKRLLAILHPAAFAARVGGDKFVLLLPNPAEHTPEALARPVLCALATPFEACGRAVSLSASIGIALLQDGSASAETLLGQADTAMHAAKSSGRSQVRVYDDALDRWTRERLALRLDLPEAFAAGQFQLHFQPKISMADADPVGAEALLRWRHPVRGLLAPQVFLEVLLESPYESVLVEWLLDAVCGQIEAWKRMELPLSRISFNLSARQLLAVGLLDRILHCAAAHGVAPAMLDVEVTEDSLVGDIDKATTVLAVLRQAYRLRWTTSVPDTPTWATWCACPSIC